MKFVWLLFIFALHGCCAVPNKTANYDYIPYLAFFPSFTRSLDETALREDDVVMLRQLVTTALRQTPLTDTDAMVHVRLAHIDRVLHNAQAAFKEQAQERVAR